MAVFLFFFFSAFIIQSNNILIGLPLVFSTSFFPNYRRESALIMWSNIGFLLFLTSIFFHSPFDVIYYISCTKKLCSEMVIGYRGRFICTLSVSLSPSLLCLSVRLSLTLNSLSFWISAGPVTWIMVFNVTLLTDPLCNLAMAIWKSFQESINHS